MEGGQRRRIRSDRPKVRIVASAPTLPRIASSVDLTGPGSVHLLLPHASPSKRGMVRKASEMVIVSSEVMPSGCALDGDAVRSPSAVQRQPLLRLCSNSALPPKAPRRLGTGHGKHSKSAPVLPDIRDQEKLNEAARQRSVLLLDKLSAVRRTAAGKAAPYEPADRENNDEGSAGGAAPSEDKDLASSNPVLVATLADLEDTEAVLRTRVRALEDAQEPIEELGGARHPTAVMCGRTLAVVRRKAELLTVVEARIAGFQAAFSQREQLLSQIHESAAANSENVNHDGLPEGLVAEDLLHIAKFVRAQVHHGGNPAEVDMSRFDAFVTSFGLPAKHRSLIQLEQLVAEATAWWARAALDAAERDEATATIVQIVNVAMAISGQKDHEMLQQCRVKLGSRFASELLRQAEEIRVRDATAVERSSKALPTSAREASDDLFRAVKSAVGRGAPPSHPNVDLAKTMACEFLQEERRRWARQAFEFAQEMKAQDEALVAEAEPNVPGVGLAAAAGEKVEAEVNTCIANGALPTSQDIIKATKIAIALRDEEGFRKRLRARERRLSAIA